MLYLDARGHYIGRIHIDSPCKYLSLQWQQANDPQFGRSTAEAMVGATFQNRRAFLLSLSHYHCPTVEMAIARWVAETGFLYKWLVELIKHWKETRFLLAAKFFNRD